MLQTLRKQEYRKLVMTSIPRWVRAIGLTVAVGVAYFLSARLGLVLRTQPDGVAVFWPAAGVASGLLIALGPGARWPVALGTMGATIAANLLGDRNVSNAVVSALSNAGETLLIAWLIERRFGPHFVLNSMHRVLGLMAAAALGTAVSGISGTAGFVYFQGSATSVLTTWQHWFLSDAVGVVAIAPLLIGLASAIRDPPPRREFIDGLAALAVLSAVAWLAVFRLQGPWMIIVPGALLFPLLLWLAVRCRPVFGSIAAFIVSLTALCTATFGLGHFFAAELPIDDRILATQASILGTSLCALVLSALLAERRENEAALVESEARLQEALTAGEVMAFEGDVRAGSARRSKSAAQILGYDHQEYLGDAKLRSFARYCSRIHPDDRARFEACVYGVRPDSPSYSITYRFFRFDDGREVWLESTSRTEFDAAGRRRYVKGLIRDVTERKRAEAELQDREDRMHAIVNTVVDGIVTIDDKGKVETLNPAAARMFGYSQEEVVGRNVNMLMPEPHRWEHDSYLGNFLTTGQAKVIGPGLVVTGLRKDGTTFPLELAVSEMVVAGQRMFTGVVRDISRRKRAEERQNMLMAELDHRVKNVLARVAVVAGFTRQGSRTMDEFVQVFDGRIQSMAAAHALLSRSGWHGVNLADLVRHQLAPYTTDANTTVIGPGVMLSDVLTQAVAMVLHELVTNAAKYGALSVPAGRISVSWGKRRNGNAAESLMLEWREIGGPPILGAIQPGYGTSLIRDLIPHELGGTVDLAFAAEGVCCRVETPLA